jgi:hypothetical protein
MVQNKPHTLFLIMGWPLFIDMFYIFAVINPDQRQPLLVQIQQHLRVQTHVVLPNMQMVPVQLRGFFGDLPENYSLLKKFEFQAKVKNYALAILVFAIVEQNELVMG